MADDTVLIPVHGSRRERLAVTRRRRHRRFAVIAAVVVVAGGAAGAYAVAHADNGSAAGGASHAVRRVLPAGGSGNQSIKALQQQGPPRIVSHDQPLKLWVGGDSIAGEIGPALGKIAGATGVVHTQVDYKVSSGLASNDIRDWYARGLMQMAQYNPEVVVFEIGTNDATIVNDTKNAAGQPAWEDAYRQKVDRMMDELVGDPAHPRTVLWLGAPPMEDNSRDKGVRALNRVMREEAGKRAPHVLYVDQYNLLEGPNGGFTNDLQTLTGQVERIRISDGVHLSDAGANYVAAVVFALLDAQWRLRQHADALQPISWDESLGSSGNSGGGSSSSGSCCSSYRSHHSSSGSGSGSGSGSNTVDTPAPPPSLDTTAPSTPNSSGAPNSSPSSSPPASNPPATNTPNTTAHQPPGSVPPASTPPST
jgi:hypothetical protein